MNTCSIRVACRLLPLPILVASLCPSGALGEQPARIETLSQDVLRFQESARFDRAARPRAAAAIRARAAAMRELIRTQPAAALSAAYPPEVLAALAAEFPDAASDLEWHGEWQGSIEQSVMDTAQLTLAGSMTRLQTGNETLDLYFAGSQSTEWKSGATVAAVGVRLGALVVVERAEVVAAASLSCSTTGPQNAAVLLVTFPGVTPPGGVTQQSMYSTFFSAAGPSLNAFWNEASHGKTSAAGNVFGYYTLDRAYSCSEASLMRDAAMSLAAAQGVNFQNYSRIFVIYPSSGCMAGFGTVGCASVSSPSGGITASTAYIQAETMAGSQGLPVLVHEAGHNLGLQHGGTLGSATETLGPVSAPGTIIEVGDYWSTMGSTTLGIYPAPQQAAILNWLSAGVNYQVVQSGGTWTLAPIEHGPAGLQALKIQRGTNNNAWLWVEYRQPVGNYDSTLMADGFTGAIVHYEDPSNGAYTRLLDFTPDGAWDTWWSPALQAGKTWTDPYSNLSLSVQSATATGLTVNVNYLAPSCVRGTPGVTVSPSNPSGAPGSTVVYTVGIKNNDSSACSPAVVSLASSVPAGWNASFSPTSLSLSPGQMATTAFTVSVAASAGVGVYPIAASAAQGSLTGSGTANVTVTAPVVPVVNLTVSGSTFGVRQTVGLNANVTYGSAAAFGAKVTFTVTDPTGRPSSTVVTADAAGNAAFSYKIGAKGPLGAYSVAASATYNTMASSKQTAAFTVR